MLPIAEVSARRLMGASTMLDLSRGPVLRPAKTYFYAPSRAVKIEHASAHSLVLYRFKDVTLEVVFLLL